MPKVNFGAKSTAKTPAMKELENKIIELFGLSLNLANATKVLGMKDSGQAKIWLEKEGVLAMDVNGRKRWLATDMARAMINSMFRAN